VRCPRGTHATGGGAYLSGGLNQQRVAASLPIDGKDADHVPDDGWRAQVDNIGNSMQSVEASAICHPDDDLVYVTKSFEARRDRFNGGTVLCPGEMFDVGGGMGGAKNLPFDSTRIVDQATSTRFVDSEVKRRGWDGRMELHLGPRRDFKIIAICHA
jgi:hypothetical protein